MSSSTDANDLLASLRDALTTTVVSNLTSASAAWDLFEAYMLTLIVEAAKRQGATVSFRSIEGENPTSLYFRSSPGAIYSSEHDYAYGYIEFPDVSPVEVHLGVYVQGKSKVIHECDVAVIEHTEAESCRNNRVHPRYASLVASVECKFYSTRLGIDLARSFLGLVADIKSDDRFFVTNISHTSVERILTHHKKRWDHEVVPRNPDDVNRLRAMFEDVFKRLKAS